MKKIVALISCTIMILLLLVGCTPAPPTDTQPTDTQPTDTQPTEPEENLQWIEIAKNCYIIDTHTREIIGQTTLELKGWMEKVDGPTFVDGSSEGVKLDGSMKIASYPIPTEDPWESVTTVHIHDEYVLCVARSVNFSSDSDVDFHYDTFYQAFFALENPEWNWITIYHGEEVLTAVCADSEEEAWDNYMNFMKVYLGLD